MNGLGTEVIQLYRGDQILRGFDDDLRDHVADADARPRHRARDPARRRRGSSGPATACAVALDNGETHVVDQVLFATGRSPNTAGLGLEALGVAHRAPNGAVEVDALVADRGALDLRGRRRHRPRTR